MAKTEPAKIREMSLEGLIALIFTPMLAVFTLLLWLAPQYAFLQDKPVHLILLGLVVSLSLSLLIWVGYARVAPFRGLLRGLSRRAYLIGDALSRFARSKWGFRIVTACLLAAMIIVQWLIQPAISVITAFAFNTLLFLCIVALLIDRRTTPTRGVQPTTYLDTFDHGLTHWEAEDLDRAMVNEGVGVPPPSLDLFPVDDRSQLKYVLAFRGIPEFRRGTIECDVQLTGTSLLNILFMADIQGRQFYMARVDSRPDYTDSFLEMEPLYAWWEYRAQSQTVTPVGQWVHIRLEVGSTSAVLYRDNGEILRIALSDFRHKPEGYQIGLFCELGAVLVDNFAVAIA